MARSSRWYRNTVDAQRAGFWCGQPIAESRNVGIGENFGMLQPRRRIGAVEIELSQMARRAVAQRMEARRVPVLFPDREAVFVQVQASDGEDEAASPMRPGPSSSIRRK